MAQLVSYEYAKAIFELAVEKNQINDYYEQTQFLLNCLAHDEPLRNTLLHPQISGSEKLALFERIFKGKVEDDFLGLLAVLLRKNRENELLRILQRAMELIQEYRGVLVAVVQSAIPLSADQKTRICAKLENSLGKTVELEVQVLPELIGGLCVRVNGRVMDITVKRQFDEMKKFFEGVTK